MHKSTIEHKYSIGQSVYIIENNQVAKKVISKMIIFIYENNTISIEYVINTYNQMGSKQVPENIIFETKADLLKSL